MFRIDIEKHPKVKQKLQALLGSKADLSKLAVFEARANDSLPISGAGGFLKNARMTRSYLQAMADKVNGGQYVPIIKLHDQNSTLPIGRIFDAAVFESNENTEENDLHVIFYVDHDSTYAADIEKAILAEMSTGTTPADLKCSACGFDFLASEDNRKYLYKGKNYDPMCPEGHQWGVGGNHLKLSALNKWKEMSVVSRGAVDRAKILSESEFKLATSEKQINLAANDNSDTLLLVTLADAAPDALKPNKNVHSNENEPMTDVTLKQEDYKALLLAEAKVEDFEAKLQASKDAEQAALAEKATADQAKIDAETAKADAEAKLSAANTDLDAEKAKVTELETKLAAATSGAGNKGKGVGEGDQGGEANLSAGLDTSYFKAAN